MRMDHALAMARRLMAEHGLTGWTVVADRAKTRAGVCRFGTRQIGLSRPLTELHSEDEVRDTILHEIAHALVGPEHGHDRVWRAKARAIGSSGERCLSSESPRLPGDWQGTCPAGHEITRHKAPTRVLTCGRCSKKFDVRHLVRWTHRGRAVPMPESYAVQLRHLLGSSEEGARVRLGDRVRITASGPYVGLVGEIELVGAVRCQVRIGDELLSVPRSAFTLESVPPESVGVGARASRWLAG